MPALPKRRWSTHRQGKKRKTHTIRVPDLVKCRYCQEPKLPHRVCPKCGYYKGREVVKSSLKDKAAQKGKKSKL